MNALATDDSTKIDFIRVACFNTFITMVSMKWMEKVRELQLVKASKEFEGTPWLEYDVLFRKEAAVDPSKSWEVVDQSSWTPCFTAAKPRPQAWAMAAIKEEKHLHPFQSHKVCRNYNHKCY